MLENGSTKEPKAHSIIALGFSRSARRFLMRAGIKTYEALASAGNETLAQRGASAEMIEEIRLRVPLPVREPVHQSVSMPELGAGYPLESDSGEEKEVEPKGESGGEDTSICTAGGEMRLAQDEVPAISSSCLFDESARDRAASEKGIDSESAFNFNRPLINAIEGENETQEKDSSESRSMPKLESKTATYEFCHTTLNCFLAGIGQEEAGLAESKTALQTIAEALIKNADKKIAIHSSDKIALEAIACEAALLFEELESKWESVESYYAVQLEGLNFNTRARNIFSQQLGIHTVGDLCAVGEKGVLKCRGAGAGVIENIKNALSNLTSELVNAFVIANGKYMSSDGLGRAERHETTKAYMAASSLEEAPLNITFLSVRAQNVLTHNRIVTVGQVLEMGEEGLASLQNAGAKTVSEIMTCATAQADAHTSSEASEMTIVDEMESDLEPEHRSNDCPDESQSAACLLLTEVSQTAVISPFAAADITRGGLENPDVVQSMILESLLVQILKRNPWGLNNEEIGSAVHQFDAEIEIDVINAMLARLKNEGRCEHEGGVWKAVEKSIEEAVSMRVANSKWRSMALARLRGDTLEAIGRVHGVTRERVRQIISKALDENAIDGTRASRYLDLMLQFDLSERAVRYGLGATAEEWSAASFIKNAKYKSSRIIQPAEALLERRSIPARVRFNLEREIHHGYVKIDGEYVKKRRLDLMLFALKRYASQRSLEDKKFLELYTETLREFGIDHYPELQLSERYMSTFRLQKNVLSGYWTRVRYYDFDKFNVRELIDSLGFEDFEGKEISTKIFLINKPDLLKEYEIDDAYELHSLLRSYAREAKLTGEDIPYTMTRRMPTIRIGETNREAQVVELARELSPISIDEFAEFYEAEYGVDQATVKGDYIQYITNYIVNGVVSMNLEPFTDEERRRMSELFPGDYYKLSTFEAAYLKEFPHAGKERLNARSIRDLGFKVYSACIIRSNWASQNDYFKSLISRAPFFEEKSVSREILDSQPYKAYRDGIMRARKLLPYDDGTWITELGLEELGITDKQLLDLAGNAAKFCEQHELKYCTVHSLKCAGFDHELFSYEMSDDFYITAICSEGTRFSALKCNQKKIACLDDAPISIAGFLDAQVGEGESIIVEDLIDYIASDLGVCIARDKVLQAPTRTNLYYNEITNMIYKDKEVFIREVS